MRFGETPLNRPYSGAPPGAEGLKILDGCGRWLITLLNQK